MLNSYHIYYTYQDDPLSTVNYGEYRAKSLPNLLKRLGKVHLFEVWCNGVKIDPTTSLDVNTKWNKVQTNQAA